MAYQPYNGPVIDLDRKHYHRWHLGTQMVLQCDGGAGCPMRFDPFGGGE